jgi:hypothetical protein
MQAIRQHVTIQPDGLIHIHVPELKPGTVAEVIILESGEIPPKSAMASLIGKGRGAFASREAVDTFIRRERNLWE